MRVLPTRDEEVYEKVRSFKEVREISLTYGEYDLVLKVEVNSLEELDGFIFNKLRVIDGIEATTTLIEARPSWMKGED